MTLTTPGLWLLVSSLRILFTGGFQELLARYMKRRGWDAGGWLALVDDPVAPAAAIFATVTIK